MLIAGLMLNGSVLMLSAFVYACHIYNETQMIMAEIGDLDAWLELSEDFIDPWGSDTIDDELLTEIKNTLCGDLT